MEIFSSWELSGEFPCSLNILDMKEAADKKNVGWTAAFCIPKVQKSYADYKVMKPFAGLNILYSA